MAHKVVKYRLESDGTIPTWLKFGVSQQQAACMQLQIVVQLVKRLDYDWHF